MRYVWQIVVVCALVVGAELQVGIEPIGHPVHDVRDLQAGGFRGEPGVSQVVEGGNGVPSGSRGEVVTTPGTPSGQR